jgi:hypothetical protein
MTKGELLTVVLGIIGLVADIITIVEFTRNSSVELHSSGLGVAAFVFPVVYGWFVFSWVIVRWKFRKLNQIGTRRRKFDLVNMSSRAVVAIGMLLLPFVAYVGYSAELASKDSTFFDGLFTGIGGSVFAMFIVGSAITLVLVVGMPLIYDDMA